MAKSKSKNQKKVSSQKPSHEHKKKILLKGIAMHVLTYIIIGAILIMLGVPFYIVFIISMVLLWGLFVLSYAMWNEK